MDNTEKTTLQILSNATGTNTELLNIKVSPETGDIVVQLDVFNESSESNKSSRASSTSSIDFNSHHEVFQAILQQISNTPHKLTFLNVLHHLLRIDSNEVISDAVWNVIEKLVHRATQLENNEDVKRMLSSTITQTFSCQICNAQSVNSKIDNDTNIGPIPPTSSLPSPTPQSTSAPPPPPPPPPMQGITVPLPPVQILAPQPPRPPLNITGPPPPPPLQKGAACSSLLSGTPSANVFLPQQNTPKSSKKLKSLNWSKIPHHKIMHKSNIWTIMANDRQYKCVEVIDFKGIEGLFCLQTTNKEKSIDDVDTSNSRRVRQKTIHLLDSKFSLKINIFLSQFKSYKSHEDIVQLIHNCDYKSMGLEKLKDLTKFFENEEIISLLTNFNGDRQKLGNAEKFMLLVMDMPNYKLRIESMKLKEEFHLNCAYLKPCIQEILKAGSELMKSQTLQEILAIIIIIGNFLNSDGYAGNAAGIKLSSLNSLGEIKANKNGMNLLHLIAMEVERYNPKLLNINKELAFLENVKRVNIEQIEKDIKGLESSVMNIKKQIVLPTTAEDLKQQMVTFLQDTESQIEDLHKSMEELRNLRLTMSEFFCEDLKHFKVDECFTIFHKFCEQFKQAVQENEKRLHLEQQAIKKQKLKEKQTDQTSLGGEYKTKQTNENEKFTLFEDKPTEVENLNSKKNKDDLMEFLHSQQYETFLKKGYNKRPNSLKLDCHIERERCFTHSLQDQYAENLSLKVNERKSNITEKPWKRLKINSTANHLKDRCLTPDLGPKRESLKIFIRSNSTVDRVKIIKTPLMENKPVYNFSTNDIQADKTARSTEIKRPKVSFKTMAHIAQLGHRYSSINEEDLKKTIKNLRTPTLENKEFCWSPIREQPPRKFSISPLAIDNDFALVNKIESQESFRYSNICSNSEHLKVHKNSESATCNGGSIKSLITQSDIENSNKPINQTKYTTEKETCDKTDLYDAIDHQKENQNKRCISDAREAMSTKNISVLSPLQEEYEKDSINQTLIEDKSKTIPDYIKKLEKNNLIASSKTQKQISGIPKPIFSKCFVSSLQNKLRSVSPLKHSRSSNSTTTTYDTNKSHAKLFKNNNDHLQEATFTGYNPLKISSNKKSNEGQTLSQESEDVAKINHLKPKFSKLLVNGLQSKMRSISVLKSKTNDKANFESYINVKNKNNQNEIKQKLIQAKMLTVDNNIAKGKNVQKNFVKNKIPTVKDTTNSIGNENERRLSRDSLLSVNTTTNKIQKRSSFTSNSLSKNCSQQNQLYSRYSNASPSSLPFQTRSSLATPNMNLSLAQGKKLSLSSVARVELKSTSDKGATDT